LPEIIAPGTQIDSQNVSLLPGENHIFTISGKVDDLQKIQKSIDAILWSHNRIVSKS
jgi:hypothetical protein